MAQAQVLSAELVTELKQPLVEFFDHIAQEELAIAEAIEMCDKVDPGAITAIGQNKKLIEEFAVAFKELQTSFAETLQGAVNEYVTILQKAGNTDVAKIELG